MHFEREQLIRFSHCDPAAIVFFPRYFVMFNGLVEDWFDDGLGLGYANVVVQRRIGLPTVALNCEFQLPSRMGERVQLRLSVARLGRSSIALALECRHDDQTRVRMQQVLVTTALDTGHAIAIPDDLQLPDVTVPASDPKHAFTFMELPPFVRLAERFREAIERNDPTWSPAGTPATPTFADALATQRIVDAMRTSSRENAAWVDVAPLDRGTSTVEGAPP